MSTTKTYGIELLHVGEDPQTGATITAYKCIDVERNKTVASGIAIREEVVALCQRQLELLAVALGAKWAVAVDVTEQDKD